MRTSGGKQGKEVLTSQASSFKKGRSITEEEDNEEVKEEEEVSSQGAFEAEEDVEDVAHISTRRRVKTITTKNVGTFLRK